MSFGRLEKPARHEPMSDINVTPLVDVMLVLLVIFIITAPLMSSRLELELPKANEPVTQAQEQEAFVSINVDAMPDRSTGTTSRSMPPRSSSGWNRPHRRDPETELQLRADTAVPYGKVVQLIGLAQTAGLSRIGFVADPVTGAPATPAPAQ